MNESEDRFVTVFLACAYLFVAFVAGWGSHVMFQYLSRPANVATSREAPQKGVPFLIPNPNQKGK